MYGHAIRINKGDVKAMSKAVLASLKHYCSTVENPQHEDCPPGQTSWCSYQRNLATGSVTYKQVKSPLAPCIQKIVQPIFEKLGSERFLQGCKNVVTSNANESFHHLLWNLAPKEQFTSSQEIELAMNLSLCLFNSGFAWTYEKVLKECGLMISTETRDIFRRIDYIRIMDSDYKSLDATKFRRKKKRRSKNKQADAFVRDEGIQYSSGHFHSGTSSSKRKKK